MQGCGYKPSQLCNRVCNPICNLVTFLFFKSLCLFLFFGYKVTKFFRKNRDGERGSRSGRAPPSGVKRYRKAGGRHLACQPPVRTNTKRLLRINLNYLTLNLCHAVPVDLFLAPVRLLRLGGLLHSGVLAMGAQVDHLHGLAAGVLADDASGRVEHVGRVHLHP